MEDTLPQLRLFSQTTLPSPIRHDLAVYCSPHDLTAIITADFDVNVYRLNGQVAFTIKCKDRGEATVTAVEWKPDGSLLAVGWSDGSYGVYEGGSGRLLNEGRVGGAGAKEWRLDLEGTWGGDDDEEGAGVRGFGWEQHWDKEQRQASGHFAEENLDTEAWADGLTNDHSEGMEELTKAFVSRLADLPRAVAVMDVTKVMPKLSAIPSHGLRSGLDGNRFGTKAATDGAFDTKSTDSARTVDVLFVYTDSGEGHVLLDETVPIGTFKADTGISLSSRHASNADSGIHATLATDSSHKLLLQLQDIPLDTLGGSLLHVVARETKRISSLLAYITQTIRCTTHDFTTGLALPTRLINNINQILDETSPPEGDIVHNLCHLAMTGHYKPALLEWLSDVVKEPNHKRWDQAVGTMYANIQNHIFINLIPALDRLSIAVCSLHGHARYHDGDAAFDVPAQLFKNILEGVDALRLIAYKILTICMHEWQLFRSFSKWLRIVIDISIAGPGSKSALDMEEKEAAILDYNAVLEYVGDVMMGSELQGYVRALPDFKGVVQGRDEFFEHPVVKEMGYERTLKATQEAAKEDAPKEIPERDKEVLNLQAVAASLTGHIRVAMERLALWQSKLLPQQRQPEVLAVSSGATVCDMRVLVSQSHQPEVHLLDIENGNLLLVRYIPESRNQESVCVSTHRDILDAKFLDKTSAICLRKDSNGRHLLARTALPNPADLSFEIQEAESLHYLADGQAFQPAKILVGGRMGKEVVVVFSGDGRSWRLYDLLSGVQNGNDDEQWADDDEEMDTTV